jgi:F0F1-type ATP synthase assembly protein I
VTQQLRKEIVRKAYCIPLFQSVVTVTASILWFFFVNKKEGLSVFLGGCLSFIPMIYVAQRLFSLHGAQKAQKIVSRFYRAEITKLLVMGCLFIAAINYGLVSPLSFVFGFVVTQASVLFAPLLCLYRF